MVEVAYTKERSTSLVEPPEPEFSPSDPHAAVETSTDVIANATTALRRRDGAAVMRDRMGPSSCGRVGRIAAPPGGGPWCGGAGRKGSGRSWASEACGGGPRLALAPQEAVDGDRDEDDGTGGEGAPVHRDAEVDEPAGHDAQQHRAEHGADDGRAAAAQWRAADDGGADREELETAADVRVAGAEEGQAEHAGEAGQAAHEHEGLDADAGQGDAGERRGVGIGTDGPDAVAEGRGPQHERQHDADHDQDEHAHRDAEQAATEELEEG